MILKTPALLSSRIKSSLALLVPDTRDKKYVIARYIQALAHDNITV